MWAQAPEEECVQTLTGHGGSVTAVTVSAGLIVSCSVDGTVRVWAVSEGRRLLLYPWFACHQVIPFDSG